MEKGSMSNFRWKVAWIIFIISFISYMDRVALSVATPVIMKEYEFTKMDMGLMQSFFFAGYALMQVPGGMLAEKFGARLTGAFTVVFWSVFTALTAVAKGKFMFAGARFLFGVGEGPCFPAFALAIFRWFNKTEKGNASSFLLGGCFFGPVVGPAATIALMQAFGWKAVFWVFGAIGCLVAWIWYKYVPLTPEESPYVNEAELAYINEGRDLTPAPVEKKLAPWGKFLKSSQFWAIGMQYFIADYIMYVFLSWLPLYLMEAHGFSMAKMGFWAAMPWIALIAVTFNSGYFCDKAIANGGSVYWVRTLAGSVGIIICAIALYIASGTSDEMLNIMWMSISLGALGLTFNASWACAINLGGEFAGSISGWMNFWGNVGGVLAPSITAWLATTYGWEAALLGTAFSGILGIVAWFMVRPDKSIV